MNSIIRPEIAAAVVAELSKSGAILCPADAPFLCKLAEDLIMNESAESVIVTFAGNALAETINKAVGAAAHALAQYRIYTRANDGAVFAATVPVRKAVPAGDGGGLPRATGAGAFTGAPYCLTGKPYPVSNIRIRTAARIPTQNGSPAICSAGA